MVCVDVPNPIFKNHCRWGKKWLKNYLNFMKTRESKWKRAADRCKARENQLIAPFSREIQK